MNQVEAHPSGVPDGGHLEQHPIAFEVYRTPQRVKSHWPFILFDEASYNDVS
jgi:hypothetical protein